MVDFTGVDGTMSLNDVQRMQGTRPPNPGEQDYYDVKRAFLENNEPKNLYVNYAGGNPEKDGAQYIKAESTYQPDGTSVGFSVIKTEPYIFDSGDDDEHAITATFIRLDEIVNADGEWIRIAFNNPKIVGTPLQNALNNQMLDVISKLTAGTLPNYPRGNNIFSGDYENILDRLGVTPRQM